MSITLINDSIIYALDSERIDTYAWITKRDASGTILDEWSTNSAKSYGIIVDSTGDLWLSAYYDGYVRKFASDGTLLLEHNVFADVGKYPEDVGFDSDGNIYVLCEGSGPDYYIIAKYSSEFSLITSWSVMYDGDVYAQRLTVLDDSILVGDSSGVSPDRVIEYDFEGNLVEYYSDVLPDFPGEDWNDTIDIVKVGEHLYLASYYVYGLYETDLDLENVATLDTDPVLQGIQGIDTDGINIYASILGRVDCVTETAINKYDTAGNILDTWDGESYYDVAVDALYTISDTDTDLTQYLGYEIVVTDIGGNTLRGILSEASEGGTGIRECSIDSGFDVDGISGYTVIGVIPEPELASNIQKYTELLWNLLPKGKFWNRV